MTTNKKQDNKKNRNLAIIFLALALIWYAVSMAMIWKH
jgi:hypothetical protein